VGNEILDLPDNPKRTEKSRGAKLLIASVVSYVLFWIFSFMHWPFAYVFVIVTSIFLVVYVLEHFVSDKEKTILDYWIFLNVLIFIVGFSLRSLEQPHGNFALFIFVISASLMFVYYFIKKKLAKN